MPGPKRNWKQCLCKLLERQTNSNMAFQVVVTGKLSNRGAGYGLGIPCEYIFTETTRHHTLAEIKN